MNIWWNCLNEGEFLDRTWIEVTWTNMSWSMLIELKLLLFEPTWVEDRWTNLSWSWLKGSCLNELQLKLFEPTRVKISRMNLSRCCLNLSLRCSNEHELKLFGRTWVEDAWTTLGWKRLNEFEFWMLFERELDLKLL